MAGVTTGPADPACMATAELVASMRRQLGARVVETHVSWVLLDGTFAWKIKKPVRLPFLDFSELATRGRLCLEELRLNRRLAPDLYVDVVPIHGTPTAPRLHGDGPAIEYALRMHEFPPGALLSEQLVAGTLQPEHLDRLAQRLAAFHAGAEVAGPDTPHGTPETVAGDSLRAVEGLALHGAAAADCETLRTWLQAQAVRLRPVWLDRRRAGRVREGHGDLHLANAVLLAGGVTAFDCLEFDPALRWIDVFSDIAFLVMDLLAHGRGDLAFRFLNAYLDESGDHAGLPVLRWYLVYRALVRALVARIRSGQGGAQAGPDHLALALRLATEGDARLLITHGVSGSGKSWVAQRLLQQAQAIRLRSDVERKRLFGLRALDASASLVPGGIYGSGATQRTYARLREVAAVALAAGQRVIVDAAFLRLNERNDFRRLAQACRVPFTLLHCTAPYELLRQRVQARGARADDASEADLAVLDEQLAWAEPLAAEEQGAVITVDTGAPVEFEALVARWLGAR
jgi:aminoglycoside phosphotransferase family enzyme/predicted kinase